MDAVNTTQESGLVLRPEHRDQMLADVGKRMPEEACGLIAGFDNQAIKVVPITNEFHSAIRYRMDPLEQLDAFDRFDQHGLELLAIYHSHPNGPDLPSATDIAEASYPGVIYLIWFRIHDEWDLRGFLIANGRVTEVQIAIRNN